MQAAREHITFASRHTTYPDGVVSNFEFHGNEQIRPVWRYLDLGPHVVYLSNIVKRTLIEQMREQSRCLRNHGRARQALKDVVEMPDQQADRVIRSIEQNKGELSNALVKQMPVLSETGVWAEIIEAVSQAFQEDLPPIPMQQLLSPSYGHEKLDNPTLEDLIDIFEDSWTDYIFSPCELLLKTPHGDIAVSQRLTTP